MQKILDDYVRTNLVGPSNDGDEIGEAIVLDESLREILQLDQSMSKTDRKVAWKRLHRAWKDRMEPAFLLEEMPGRRVVCMGHGQPPIVFIVPKLGRWLL